MSLILNITQNSTLTCINNCIYPPVYVWGSEDYFDVIFIVILLCLSGIFSGLTLSMVALDQVALKIISEAGGGPSQEYARRILPLKEKGNLLICTVIIGNVCVNSALSIVSANVFTGLIGFFVSITLITVIGEIFPQAIFNRKSTFPSPSPSPPKK